MIKQVKIYDMDGTIVDSLHRYATIEREGKIFIDLPYWVANKDKAMKDTLLPLAKEYQKDILNPEVYVIIATARVLYEPDTRFIREILGQPDYIISRKEGDIQSGITLKINGLTKFFNLVNFRKAQFIFFEDNASYLKGVCDKFKILGVYTPSLQGH